MGTKDEKLKVNTTFNGMGSMTDSLKQLGINHEIDNICEVDIISNKKTDHIDDDNKLDTNYLNLTQDKFEEYKKQLENGGTISISVPTYKKSLKS